MLIDRAEDLAPACRRAARTLAAASWTASPPPGTPYCGLRIGDPVYGVNTGMGDLSKVRLTEDEQRVHQRNLLLGRAVGGRPGSRPTKPEPS